MQIKVVSTRRRMGNVNMGKGGRREREDRKDCPEDHGDQPAPKKSKKKKKKEKAQKERDSEPTKGIRPIRPIRELTIHNRRRIELITSLTPLTGRLSRMSLTRRRTRPIHLFRMMIDKRLHPNSAHIKHIATSNTRRLPTRHRSPSTDTATTTSGWDGRHSREMQFRGPDCRPAVRGRHRALTGEAAESVEGWWAGGSIASFAIVGEARDVWSGGC
jgi:hypothetical protein